MCQKPVGAEARLSDRPASQGQAQPAGRSSRLLGGDHVTLTLPPALERRRVPATNQVGGGAALTARPRGTREVPSPMYAHLFAAMPLFPLWAWLVAPLLVSWLLAWGLCIAASKQPDDVPLGLPHE